MRYVLDTNICIFAMSGSFDTTKKNAPKPIDLQGFERVSFVGPKSLRILRFHL